MALVFGFGGDKNILELDVVIVVNILKTTGLHLLKMNFILCELYVNEK